MFDKAVLIGIKLYKNSGMSSLDGPYQDVMNMETYIKSKNSSSRITKMLDIDKSYIQPTRENILDYLKNLYNDVKPGEKVLIYYSGHGSNVKTNSKDEYDQNYDQAMNVMNNKIVTDNEINGYVTENIPKKVEVYLIFDCCHSGDIVDLKYKLQKGIFKPIRKSLPDLDNKIVLMSGCAFTQSTTDAPKGGAFTNRFLDVIKDNHKVSYLDLYNTLQKDLNYLKVYFGMSQEPQIFSSLSYKETDSIFY